jgi:hypothetical protein
MYAKARRPPAMSAVISTRPQKSAVRWRHSETATPHPLYVGTARAPLEAVKNLIFVLFLASSANAQTNLRNSVTFSVGSAFTGPRGNGQFNTTVGLGATYRYRWFHYLDIEADITTALHPTPTLRGATFTIDPTDNFIWVPFGLRGVLPLRNGAMELSAGAGGIYENYSAGNIPPFVGRQSEGAWGGYFVAGAASAISRSRHYWLGASAREFLGNANRTSAHDLWFVVTGDFSFRF